ncbi:hypothetical protein CEXT_198321, partial [Caerostris extrusa]
AFKGPLRGQGTALNPKPRDKPIRNDRPPFSTHDMLLHRTSCSIHPCALFTQIIQNIRLESCHF